MQTLPRPSPHRSIRRGWARDSPPPTTLAEKRRITFVIADVGIGRGDTHCERVRRKQTHTTEGSTLGYADDIIPTLRKSGFNAIGFNEKSLLDSETKGMVDQYIGIISIGITGEMYTSTQHVLQAMDLNKYQSKCLMQALHKHACATSERTIKSRRALEFGSAPQADNAANPIQPGAADPG